MNVMRYSELNRYEREFYDQLKERYRTLLVYKGCEGYMIRADGLEFFDQYLHIAFRKATQYER